ncbi:hypothetical protein EDB81DRAFT_79041 [Dactylonectria macrodidyma]|uniref:BZIP domain-containing protein n=1 Tax=Dactylonectria macrodidyma TaxID=307937 RepID=A0A9P9IWP4_9HYPO|nr:hypothetical protein EDB81DRAFT_79041 [Dactylonectria macrodidyma]
MGTAKQYIDGSGSYGDDGHNPTLQSFVHIDPLLTLATDADDTTPPIWCPTWNEPVDMFDAALPEPFVPVAFPTAQSFSSNNEQSPPETVPNEPVMIVSQASITSSDPIGHVASPPKGKRPRRAKQQPKKQAQQRGQDTSQPSQEPLPTPSAIKVEVNTEVQDGEEDEVEIEEDEETKRDQFLARNRLAASKCRQRKREWEENLEARKSEAENRHEMLKAERNLLIENIDHLKGHILSHGLCKDPNIDSWLQHQAQRIYDTPSDQNDGAPLGDASLGHKS